MSQLRLAEPADSAETPQASAPGFEPAGLSGLLLMLGPVFAACLLLYHQVLFFGKALYFRDIYHNYFAMLDFITRSLRAGELPLWNPYLFSGTPQLAGLEPPIFYPPGWIFFLGLPYQLALALNLIGHHLLAAAGVYLLGRAYGWRWFSATLAACLFSFSGVMVSMNNFHPLQNTVAWLPLVFWAGHRLLTRQGLRDLAVLGLVYGLQLLSGHLEIVYFETLLLLAYGAGLLWRRRALRRPRVVAMTLAAGLLALGLGAIQILPAMLYLPASVRQAGLGQTILIWSFHPILTLLLLLPEQAGNTYHGASLNTIFGEEKFGYSLFFLSAYLGVLTWALVLTGLSLLHRLGARFGFFVAVFFSTLLLAYGKFLPLYQGLLALPGAGFFRYPSKLLVFASFGLVMAAGCVCQELLVRPERLRRLMGALGLLAGLALSAWLGLRLAHEGFAQALMALMASWRPDVAAGDRELWTGFFLGFFDRQLLSVCALALLFLGLAWLLRRTASRLALILLLLAVNLDLLASGVNSLWMVEGERYATLPEPAKFLAERKLAERPQERMLFADKQLGLPDSFEPELIERINLRASLYKFQAMHDNFGMVHGFRSLFGEWPGLSYKSEYSHQLYLLAIQARQLAYRRSFESLGAARYLLLTDPAPELEAIFLDDPKTYRHLITFPDTRVEIWENLAWLPRARFQYQAMTVKSPELMISAMSNPETVGFDLRRHLLLLDDAALKAAREAVPAAEAKDKRWTEPNFVVDKNNRVEVSFETNTSGYLVLADQNLPGWKAYDNGREVPILLANYMHRAVRVGPGQHRIRFEYRAPGFAAGAGLSGVSLLALLGLLLGSGRRRAGAGPAQPVTQTEAGYTGV